MRAYHWHHSLTATTNDERQHKTGAFHFYARIWPLETGRPPARGGLWWWSVEPWSSWCGGCWRVRKPNRVVRGGDHANPGSNRANQRELQKQIERTPGGKNRTNQGKSRLIGTTWVVYYAIYFWRSTQGGRRTNRVVSTRTTGLVG